MPKINLAARAPRFPKRAPIVSVRPAMRSAQRYGVDPYNSRDEVMLRYERYARMCGAKLMQDVSTFLRPQAD